MRILVISHYFHPESFRVNDLVLALGEKGHRVTVLTGLPNYPSGSVFRGYGIRGPWHEQALGASIVRVPVISRGRGTRLRMMLNFISFPISASLLGPLRCKGRFDVIFVFQPSPATVGIPAVVMKWKTRAPIAFWVQDLWPDTLESLDVIRSKALLGLVRRMVLWIYRRCERILVPSRAFVAQITSLGIKPEKVAYVPNWAEKLYRPVVVDQGAPEEREMPAGFRIVFAGAIAQSQAPETIVEAATRLQATHPAIQWVMIGDGRKAQWMRAEVARRGLDSTVHFLGQRPVETMPRYFALADALLVTLRNDPAYRLTIPSKLQSYLACGKPILACVDGEGARIVREARSGVVARAGQGDDLATQAIWLSQLSKNELKRLGDQGRAYFLRHFERDRVIDELERLMKNLSEVPN